MNLADFKHQREIQDILRATNPMQKILGKEKASDLLVPESRLVLVHPCSFVQDVTQGIVLPVDYSRHQQAMMSSALLSQPTTGGGLLQSGEDHSALSGDGGGDAVERLLMSRQSSATLVSIATLNDALEPHEILLEKPILNTQSRRHQRQLKMMLSQEVARSRQRLLLCRSGVLDPYGHQEALERLRDAPTPQQPAQMEEVVDFSATGGRQQRRKSTLGEAIDTHHNVQPNRGMVDSPHFSSEEGSEVDDDEGLHDDNSSFFGGDLLTSHLASLRSTNTGRLTGHHQSFFFTDIPENDDDDPAMSASTLEPRATKLSVRLAGASSSIPLSLLSKDSHLTVENAGSGVKPRACRKRGSFLGRGGGNNNNNNSGDVSMYHNPFRAPAAGSEEETLQRKLSRRSTDAGSFRRRSSLVQNGSFTLALQKADEKINANYQNNISSITIGGTATSPRSTLRKRNQANMFGADVTGGVQEEQSGGAHRRGHTNNPATRNLSITTTATVSPNSSRGTSPNISPQEQQRRRRSTKKAVAVDVSLDEKASRVTTTTTAVDDWTPSASTAAGANAALEDFQSVVTRRQQPPQDPVLGSETYQPYNNTTSTVSGGTGGGRRRTASPQVNNRSLSSPLKGSSNGTAEMSEEDKQRALLERQRELFFKFPDFKSSAVLAREEDFIPPPPVDSSTVGGGGSPNDNHVKKQQQQRRANINNSNNNPRSTSSLDKKSPARGGGTLSPIAQHLGGGAEGPHPRQQHSHRLGLVAHRSGDGGHHKKQPPLQQHQQPTSPHRASKQQQQQQQQLSQQQHLHQQIQQQRHAAMSKLSRCVHNIRLEPLASGQKHQEIMKASHDTTDKLSANALEKLERRVREQPAKYAKKFAALDLNGKLPFHASAGAVLEHVEHLILQQERESSRRDAHDKISARLEEIASYCLGRFQHPAARNMVLKTQKLVVDDDAIPTSDMFTARLIYECPPHMFLLDELTTVAVHLAEIYGMSRDDAIKSIRHYARAFVVDRRDGVATRLGGGGGGASNKKWNDDDEFDDDDDDDGVFDMVGGSMLR
ncbi:Hypothetical protein, putative [Bodo saltans]|uniref:Uncharacterized protein n=1 Tax=Bodo saltans TaxID=75058 RepID=A0A0S4IXD6_BODSA|nr:Hypothetical protein, putative [Bodo saltans]|eukprot:CUG07122.1 Hypothetical protein, putative [Bodo saltans]